MEKSAAPAEEADEASSATAQPSSLSIFHEDIILSILSFVADVPFEMGDTSNGRAPIDSHSTLTNILPLVSKQIHKLTYNHDLFWKNALLRLVHNEPTLWEEGLKRTIFDAKCDELREEITERNRIRATTRRDKRTKDGQLKQQQNLAPQSNAESEISSSSNSAEDSNSPPDDTAPLSLSNNEILLQEACAAIQSYPPRHHTANSSGIYQCIYQSILCGHMRYQAPIFYMPSAISLGDTYGLHLFEPRYRLLMAEVMATYPVSARRGENIYPMVPGLFPAQNVHVMADDIKASTLDLLEKNEALLRNYQRPMFIHAHQSPLRPNTPATIVQVEQCIIQADGSADVFLKPLSFIWLEEIWERPGTGGLVEARGLRMGKEASETYERYLNS